LAGAAGHSAAVVAAGAGRHGQRKGQHADQQRQHAEGSAKRDHQGSAFLLGPAVRDVVARPTRRVRRFPGVSEPVDAEATSRGEVYAWAGDSIVTAAVTPL
jgi:hypothetical protein